MKKWLQRNPFALLLLPLIIGIWACNRGCERTEADTARTFYQVVMRTAPQDRPSSVRYEAYILDSLPKQPTIHLVFPKSSTTPLPQRGDTVLVYTQLQHPHSFGYVPAWAWRTIGDNQQPWWQTSTGWQQRLMQRYDELGIHGREHATLSALTLGYRGDLDNDVLRQFTAAGAMHVLAVSGLHTGILLAALMAIITLFGWRKPMYEQRAKRIAQGCVVMACMVAFAWLTGCTPSVVRATLMASLFIMAAMTNRKGSMLNIIFASAFLTLLFRPMDLFSVSFQLSYAAVIAIALVAPRLNALSSNYIIGLLGISLAAQIGTMPLTLYYYGQISNYFLLTNLIVLPLAWLMMVGGLAILTIGWWTPAGKVLAWIVDKLTWLMNEGVARVEQLPCACTQVYLSRELMWALIAVNVAILIAFARGGTRPT